MKIFIKTLTGKTLIFDVEHTDTVGEVKLKIKDKDKCPHQNVRGR